MGKIGDGADYIEHPLRVAELGEATMVVFPGKAGSALIHGSVTDGVVVRLQSACQYGEIYGSLECDCREQLDLSMARMRDEGAGILIHLLDHEGRGAGLRAKARAYRHRRHDGLDTFESYARQGIPGDTRDYEIATEFLKKHLDLHHVRLLTNNPEKIGAVRMAGIEVEHVPLIPVDPDHVHDREECSDYLRVKARHGHLIPPPRRTGQLS